MISWNKKLTRGVLMGTMGLLIAAVGACKPSDSDPLKWTEDVKLPDGRIVTLTRYQEFKGGHELFQKPTESDYWFEFKHPDTKEVIRWESNNNLATLVLLIDGAKVFLLTTPNLGDALTKFNRPNPPYFLYRYEKGWKMDDLLHMPLKRVRVNMTFSAEDSRSLIIESKYKLSASTTGESEFSGRPYWINFTKMKMQTFGEESLGRKLEWLVD